VHVKKCVFYIYIKKEKISVMVLSYLPYKKSYKNKV
jgi:hypothetical protein